MMENGPTQTDGKIGQNLAKNVKILGAKSDFMLDCGISGHLGSLRRVESVPGLGSRGKRQPG